MDSNPCNYNMNLDDSDEFINLEAKQPPKKQVKDKVVQKKHKSVSRKREVDYNNKIGEKNNKNEDEQICKEFRNKIFNNINRQLNSRKKIDETLQNNLVEAINNLEEKHNSLIKDIEQLENFFNATMSSLDETEVALHEKIESLVELERSFIKQCNIQDESKIAQSEEE